MSTIVLDPELTISYVSELKDRFLSTLEQERDVTLDVSQVVEFDGAGLQLLISLKKWCRKHNKTMRIEKHSDSVSSVLALIGADVFFGDPIIMQEQGA